ncbi:MAG TPA: NAD-dependent epimerase/dehydratase family protein, partial [Pirellulaceae bacterium]
MTTLVTGATGFIGWHVCRLLRGGDREVRALVRSTAKGAELDDLGVARSEGNLCDPASLRGALQGVTSVIHLAGLTKALRHRELFVANEAGTRNLLEAAASSAAPPVIVLVSSLAAVGPANSQALREGDPANPVSHYGRSKRAGELVAESFASLLPITVVRPPIVFGERDRATLAMFKAIQQLGVHVIPGLAPKYFSLIHAQDLSQLLVRAVDSGERLPPEKSLATAGTGYFFADSGR